MFRIGLMLLFVICAFCCKAQQIEILSYPTEPDSSLYDIIEIDENKFWACGESGVLIELDEKGNQHSVHYPFRQRDLLKVEKLKDGRIMLLAENGLLIFYNPEENSWYSKLIEGYENKVFYESCVRENGEVYICGGAAKVIKSKKTLPRGFVLRSDDNGENWERVYGNVFSMVWDIDAIKDSIVALTYNPFSKKRLLKSSNGNNWIKSVFKSKGLYHALSYDHYILAGGSKIDLTGSAIIAYGKSNFMINESPFVWSSRQFGENIISACSDGMLIFLHDGNAEILKTEIQTAFYEIVSIDDHSVFVVGSGKAILRLSW